MIALAGNPNVGKSTVFNALTGMNQHTGNWPGKTVSSAQGHCTHNGREYLLVDIPGTYSLMAHSAEEEVARDFICFGQDGRAPDAVVVVCDATCLERNLNLVLQTLEITANVVVCVNLMDEARKRGVQVDLPRLSAALGVPVVGTSARSEKGLDALMDAVEKSTSSLPVRRHSLRYGDAVEEAVRIARLAREVCHTDFVKVEIEHETKYLLPDNAETIRATEMLAKEGFVVMPYMFPDPIAARQLEEAGAAAVMPLGSLIGSNMGLRMRDFIEIIIANAHVPVIIDAGIGRPSQACDAMEMGADAVMAYTAVASAGNIPLMAEAFKQAIEAGRTAYLAGLGRVRETASASSPLTGFLQD